MFLGGVPPYSSHRLFSSGFGHCCLGLLCICLFLILLWSGDSDLMPEVKFLELVSFGSGLMPPSATLQDWDSAEIDGEDRELRPLVREGLRDS